MYKCMSSNVNILLWKFKHPHAVLSAQYITLFEQTARYWKVSSCDLCRWNQQNICDSELKERKIPILWEEGHTCSAKCFVFHRRRRECRICRAEWVREIHDDQAAGRYPLPWQRSDKDQRQGPFPRQIALLWNRSCVWPEAAAMDGPSRGRFLRDASQHISCFQIGLYIPDEDDRWLPGFLPIADLSGKKTQPWAADEMRVCGQFAAFTENSIVGRTNNRCRYSCQAANSCVAALPT